MSDSRDIEDDIVAAIRRIIRAIDLQSRRLFERHALTGPQLATLREAARQPGCTTGSLARSVHLSQPTVTGILNRLERRGLVRRERSSGDRRNVQIHVSAEGTVLLAEAPSLLQERFRSELARIEPWERHALLASLQRIASMMDAGELDAAPILDTRTSLAEPEDADAIQRGSPRGSGSANEI